MKQLGSHLGCSEYKWSSIPLRTHTFRDLFLDFFWRSFKHPSFFSLFFSPQVFLFLSHYGWVGYCSSCHKYTCHSCYTCWKSNSLPLGIAPKSSWFSLSKILTQREICKPILGLLDSEGPTVMMPCWGVVGEFLLKFHPQNSWFFAWISHEIVYIDMEYWKYIEYISNKNYLQ